MSSKHHRGSLRIIAGQWKRQTIRFVGNKDVRPTPNAVRETLFNWLAPVIEGANCLDLFSGSGALGFEAASRGAQRVVLVDNDKKVYQQLVHTRNLLSANQVHIYCEDALDFLATALGPFNIVFLDPPFSNKLTERVVTELERSNILRENSLVYIETPREENKPNLSKNWRLYREKKAGRIVYRLYKAHKTTTEFMV